MTRYRVPEPPRRSGLRVVGKILLWLAIGVTMLAVALVAGIYLWFHESVSAIQAHSEDVKSAQKFLGEPPAPGHAAIALVIGYDHRANEAANTPSRSDTVMLLRADPDTKSISMLSFPRDMIVPIHCPGEPIFTAKINAAYANCGAKGTVQTVADLTGLPINYLITVNFRGFKQIVNRLGGVWIDVDRRYFNNNAGLSPTFGYAKINLQPGYQLLTGGSALDYVRFRHTDSDFYRVARQQQFVKAMKFQLAHNFSIAKVPKIIGALTKNIEVGAGGGRKVSGKTVLSYAFFAYHLPSGHFFQSQIQGLTGYSDLRTDPSNIQAAVQDWLQPDVEAARVATAVALGRKVRTDHADPRADVDHGPERERDRGRGRQRRLPALAARLPDRAAAGRRDGQRAPHELLLVQGLLEPAREAFRGGGEVGREAVRARRRRGDAARGSFARPEGDDHRRRRLDLPRDDHAGAAGQGADAARTGARDLEPVRLADDAEEAPAEGAGNQARVSVRDRELVIARPGEAVLRLPDPRGRQGRAARLPHRRRSVLGDRADELGRGADPGGQERSPHPQGPLLRLLLQRP